MTPIRLRHPKGVSTLQVDLDNSTVGDLQQQIFAVSEIPPSTQDLKSGYPPKPLTAVIPELPLSSLGLAPGEQLIVNQKAVFTPPPASTRPPLPADPGVDVVNPPATMPSRSGTLSGGFGANDNSCLFSSIALVFEQDMSKAPKIRQLVAKAIKEDPETWNEAILGRPRNEYISTILSPNSWGGAIELSVLAAHYRTDIASIDVETGRVDNFSPPPTQPSTGNRVLLIYSGIHYDAAVVAPEVGAPAEWCASIVPVLGEDERSDPMIKALKQLATKLREKRAFTNPATFDLKCEICGKGLKGEKEARGHATETGHAKFGEF
ncbi:hypothetical protein EWM64_g1646 [Hericium alpestre]|uniref:Ubiquitin thioesterase OTU n=1 Tax=Hericium alpestre TaxID=135208 RepID=A0A4Z0A5T6_9AGAM|nr:hypothetical protein EWM64_g1646 [Hericium alpestre]